MDMIQDSPAVDPKAYVCYNELHGIVIDECFRFINGFTDVSSSVGCLPQQAV